MEKRASQDQAFSMVIHAATGQKLISESTALEIARRVTLDRFGQLEVDRNLPLRAREDGNTWVILGTYSKEFNERNPPNPPWGGPLHMVISSRDGQILAYEFVPNLPWLGDVEKINQR